MKKIRKIIVLFLLVGCPAIMYAQGMNWTEVAPGVWKGVAGKPEQYDLLKAAGSVPAKEALSKMPAATFPLSKNDIAGAVIMSCCCILIGESHP